MILPKRHQGTRAKQTLVWLLLAVALAGSLILAQGTLWAQTAAPVSFGKSTLGGEISDNPTSLQFGPDGRLYVGQQDGVIKAYTVKRNGANSYSVINAETIDLVKKIPNHNDDGTTNTSETSRQLTGILVTGGAEQPVIYVGSSDPRIGAGGSGTDLDLDTNSGVISRLTKGSSGWQKVDLVRGLPRSEENHSVNGMQLSSDGNTLYVAAGGNTNQGAPSNNFAQLPEYALAAAILKVDLSAIGNTTYDLPTLGGTSSPFGGKDGDNQAKLVSGGSVQVYAPGFRNAYDLVISEGGKMYTIDNGGNAGWGDVPKGEGPAGTCTNESSEPGQTNQDQFHYVSGQGYYGGHPNPTRANKANTFNGKSPVEVAANPKECDYNKPADGTTTTFPASTNGLDEYTASNFGGDMKGDLLAAGFDNIIYRIELNSAGDQIAKKGALFNAVGSVPLDVTAQGDGGPFPGTIWAADIGTGNIAVFEPGDYGGGSGGTTCDPSDPSGDADGDGFTNADEQSNGTDPCSAADAPPDADNDKISDKNDPDDDNDGQPDTSDPFALDANNGKTTALPVRYNFDTTTSNAGGLLNLGFTGLMTNGKTNYQSLYDPNNLTAGGAAGVLTVDAVSEGDAYSTYNNQENAFQFGVDPPTSGVFTARTRIAAPFNGISPQDYQSMGIFLGTGDQDDYVKVVTSSNGGKGGIELAKEVGGQFATLQWGNEPMPGPDYVDLYLTVDPSAKTVQASYVVGIGGAEGSRTNLGAPVPIPAGWLDGTEALAAGIISTSFGAAPPFPATWDFIEVVSGNGGAQPPLDTTAPETTITSGPSGTVRSSTAAFEFSSSESGSTFECSLDGVSFSGCTSPKQYNSLANGSHTFQVRAKDAAGNVDATPASRTWIVKVKQK